MKLKILINLLCYTTHFLVISNLLSNKKIKNKRRNLALQIMVSLENSIDNFTRNDNDELVIDVQNLNFDYGGPPILKDLQLGLRKGSRCLLVGKRIVCRYSKLGIFFFPS